MCIYAMAILLPANFDALAAAHMNGPSSGRRLRVVPSTLPDPMITRRTLDFIPGTMLGASNGRRAIGGHGWSNRPRWVACVVRRTKFTLCDRHGAGPYLMKVACQRAMR
jgi:hypothetical protein